MADQPLKPSAWIWRKWERDNNILTCLNLFSQQYGKTEVGLKAELSWLQIARVDRPHCPVSIRCLQEAALICDVRACVREREVGKGSASLKKREGEKKKKKEKQTDTHLSILAGGKE